jgi:hypothetical protein
MENFKIRGDWNRMREDLKKEYPELTDTDLDFTLDGETELIGRIERRLGRKKRERIVDRINTLNDLWRLNKQP